MSASAFSFFNQAKKYMGNGTIALGSTTIDVHLMQSSSNFATKTLSTYASLTNETASANNYTKSGKSLASVTWTSGASAGQKRFNAAALVFSAVGGAISAVKAVALVARTGASAKAGANKLLCYASLTSAQFGISQNNTLTLTPSATGIFNLA